MLSREPVPAGDGGHCDRQTVTTYVAPQRKKPLHRHEGVWRKACCLDGRWNAPPTTRIQEVLESSRWRRQGPARARFAWPLSYVAEAARASRRLRSLRFPSRRGTVGV